MTTIGLTLMAVSLVIGFKSLVDLYAKIIGVSSLLDSNHNNFNGSFDANA